MSSNQDAAARQPRRLETARHPSGQVFAPTGRHLFSGVNEPFECGAGQCEPLVARFRIFSFVGGLSERALIDLADSTLCERPALACALDLFAKRGSSGPALNAEE